MFSHDDSFRVNDVTDTNLFSDMVATQVMHDASINTSKSSAFGSDNFDSDGVDHTFSHKKLCP